MRFKIACPLEVFGNYSVNTVVPEDTCTTKFFTINQEVGDKLPQFQAHSETVHLWALFRGLCFALNPCTVGNYLWLHHITWGSVEFISFLENNQVKLFCYLICRRHTPFPSWHLPLYVTLKCFPSTLNWASKIYASLTFVTHSIHHALWWSEYHPSLPMSQTQITDRWPYTSWFDAVVNKCHFFRCPSGLLRTLHSYT